MGGGNTSAGDLQEAWNNLDVDSAGDVPRRRWGTLGCSNETEGREAGGIPSDVKVGLYAP